MIALLARVPVWAWAIAALLAWGGWNGYRAKAEREAFAKAKLEAEVENARSAAAAATETARRAARMQEITDAEILRRRAAETSAARLRDADRRLRDVLASQQTAGAARDPAAADGGTSAAADPGVLADVLGQCIGRVRSLAAEADATRAAGEACERSYDSLTR